MARTNLEAAKARLAEATPGPWKYTGGVLKHYVNSTDEGRDLALNLQEFHWYDGHEVPAKANATFIAHSPSDLARALAVVEAAIEEIGIHNECPLCGIDPEASGGGYHFEDCPLAYWEGEEEEEARP